MYVRNLCEIAEYIPRIKKCLLRSVVIGIDSLLPNFYNCFFYFQPKVNETDLCTFHTVGLSNSNIACLLSQFSKIDTDHNGTICLDELMEYFDLDQSDFVARVFDVMDEDGNGDINFREFVISCYNYCTLDQESMLTFAFDLYDADSSGYIDIYEVELMLTEVYSSNFQRNCNAIALLQKIQEWKKGVNGSRRLCHLSFKDFKTFAKTHSLLLFPAFMLQQALRKKLLSRGFWVRCTKRRKELLKVNCTKNDLDVIKQGEYQVKQRLSTLDMERRSSKASGIGFGRLSKRMQNWRQTNIAKKQLAARQLEKYVVTQIKTTQGPLCNRVRARVDYKDDQELPPDLRAPTKKPSRNSSYMSNNQGGGFRHENTIYCSMALEDDHAKDHTVPGNGKEIERVSVISTLVNLFGVGRRSGHASAVVDVLPPDEVGVMRLHIHLYGWILGFFYELTNPIV